MSHIAVGLLSSHLDDLESWRIERGADRSQLQLLRFGTFDVASVDRWIGVPPPSPEMVRVNLQPPDADGPIEGEPRWLEFRPGEWEGVTEAFCCWTIRLDMVRIAEGK